MQLYVLRPSDHWNYCGGGRVVIAEDWEAVKQLFPDDKLYLTEDEVDKEEYDNIWVKVEEFTIEKETQRIVLDDYNYA